jgi:hypothetical protein
MNHYLLYREDHFIFAFDSSWDYMTLYHGEL